MGISLTVDGQVEGIDKHYFDNHKQMILSPDGFIYPEYDFLEYRRVETRIGQWKDTVVMDRVDGSDGDRIRPECTDCPVRAGCGLKYLFKIFDKSPTTPKCMQFYQMMDAIILHTQKLKTQPTIFHWIGI